jgi:hypothetical protein
MPSTVTLSTEEKVLVTVQPLTEAGNPAPVDGAATFTVTSGTCTIEGVDTLSAYVVSGSAPGDSLVTMACDADLGAGVVPVSDTLTVHVTSATAASLAVTLDEPVLK